MSDYIVYHNSEKMGFSVREEEASYADEPLYGIRISKNVSNLKGHTIWLIEGVYDEKKKRKKYYLCSRFKVESSGPDESGEYNYAGAKSGVSYGNDTCLDRRYEPWFSAFRTRMANFSLGLQKLSDEDVAQLREIPVPPSPFTSSVRDTAHRSDAGFSAEDRLSEAKMRQGQAKFAAAVVARYGDACLVCGINERKLLVAAHIVSWAKNKTHRLDPGNGLRLCVLHDKAFEYGFFTLDQKLKICVSKQVSTESVFGKELWMFHGKPLRLGSAAPPKEIFLAEHRKEWSRKGRSRTQSDQSNPIRR